MKHLRASTAGEAAIQNEENIPCRDCREQVSEVIEVYAGPRQIIRVSIMRQ
jgi:hypothetical protein